MMAHLTCLPELSDATSDPIAAILDVFVLVFLDEHMPPKQRQIWLLIGMTFILSLAGITRKGHLGHGSEMMML